MTWTVRLRVNSCSGSSLVLAVLSIPSFRFIQYCAFLWQKAAISPIAFCSFHEKIIEPMNLYSKEEKIRLCKNPFPYHISMLFKFKKDFFTFDNCEKMQEYFLQVCFLKWFLLMSVWNHFNRKKVAKRILAFFLQLLNLK